MVDNEALTDAEARALHYLLETELEKVGIEPASFEGGYIERLERVESKLADGEIFVSEKDGVTSERVLDAMTDGSVVVRCPDAETAGRLTTRLYDGVSGEVFHVEHYPETDDANGSVGAVLLVLRRVCYDRDTGWVSSDTRAEPDLVLSGN